MTDELNVYFSLCLGFIDKTTIIIGSSVTSIIIIGIIIIIIYRALLELYDIREYRNFVKAQKQTEWKEVRNSYKFGSTFSIRLDFLKLTSVNYIVIV